MTEEPTLNVEQLTNELKQLQELRMIENLQIALVDLQRYGSAPIVINTVNMIYVQIMNEYNHKYAPKPQVEESIKKDN